MSYILCYKCNPNGSRDYTARRYYAYQYLYTHTYIQCSVCYTLRPLYPEPTSALR